MGIASSGQEFTEKKWINIPSANTYYALSSIQEFFPSVDFSLVPSMQMSLEVLAKDGVSTPTTRVYFLNSSFVTISNPTFTGRNGYLKAPAQTRYIGISISHTAFCAISFGGVEYNPGITATKFTSSQTITLNSSYSFLLMGGGGSGGGSPPSNGGLGTGGGSGRITTGTINAGTYSLVIGAGATGATNSNGSTGGTSTFSTFSATGGAGGTNQANGGAGGSGGGGNNNPGGANGANGGGTSGGAGSGVALSLSIIPGGGGNVTGGPGNGGGLYAGGAGSQTPYAAGGGGNANGSGGGGGGASSGNSTASRVGGSGGSGALYLLKIG